MAAIQTPRQNAAQSQKRRSRMLKCFVPSNAAASSWPITNRRACLLVLGGGSANFNGVYVRSKGFRDPNNRFLASDNRVDAEVLYQKKDGSEAIMCYGGWWLFIQRGSGASYYGQQVSHMQALPEDGWQVKHGRSPAPRVQLFHAIDDIPRSLRAPNATRTALLVSSAGSKAANGTYISFALRDGRLWLRQCNGEHQIACIADTWLLQAADGSTLYSAAAGAAELPDLEVFSWCCEQGAAPVPSAKLVVLEAEVPLASDCAEELVPMDEERTAAEGDAADDLKDNAPQEFAPLRDMPMLENGSRQQRQEVSRRHRMRQLARLNSQRVRESSWSEDSSGSFLDDSASSGESTMASARDSHGQAAILTLTSFLEHGELSETGSEHASEGSDVARVAEVLLRMQREHAATQRALAEEVAENRRLLSMLCHAPTAVGLACSATAAPAAEVIAQVSSAAESAPQSLTSPLFIKSVQPLELSQSIVAVPGAEAASELGSVPPSLMPQRVIEHSHLEEPHVHSGCSATRATDSVQSQPGSSIMAPTTDAEAEACSVPQSLVLQRIREHEQFIHSCSLTGRSLR